jgi:ketosteroid isomerase-like protein
MSQDNVELIRRAYAAFSSDPESSFRFLDPEVVFETTAAYPDAREFRGIEGARAYFLEFVGQFEHLEVDLIDPVASADKVVGGSRLRGLGKASGASVELTVTIVWTVRDGRIIHSKNYASRAEAFEAVGLSE